MSDKQNQKEAVYSAVISTLTDAGHVFHDGMNVATILSSEHRNKINSILVEGFKSSSISLNRSFGSDAELRVYCSSLVSNWIRKDKRLNGGSSYSAKNPGSRLGSNDPQIKALRALMKNQSDPLKLTEIQSFISKRLDEIKENSISNN
jgi:hypothetical protein